MSSSQSTIFVVDDPAVLMTGHPDPGLRARAREAGLPLIEKPLALDAFMIMVAAGEAERRCSKVQLNEQPAAGSCGRGGLRGLAQGAAYVTRPALSPFRLKLQPDGSWTA